MSISTLKKQIQVIPGYRDVFRRMPTEEDLLEIVRRYPVKEWLNYLSRFQNVFWGRRSRDPEQIRSVYYGALSKELRDKIEAFARDSGVEENLVLFYEWQISTLQQFVILHAPSAGNCTFDHEVGRHDLGSALLMTYDLMDLGRDHDGQLEGLLPSIIQDRIRMSTTAAERFAVRALHFYDLRNEAPASCIAKYLKLYTTATGVDARDAILGCLCEVIREKTRDCTELAHGWHAVPHPDQCENPLEARILQASAEVRWGTLDDIREAIRQFDAHHPIRDWSLIALSKYPIVDLGEMGAFVLNHTALGRSLFDGIRHSILTAALDGHLPRPFDTEAAVGDLYGNVFQRYVTDLLRHFLRHQVVEIPEGPEERCDLLISYPDKVILAEVKGRHYIAKRHSSHLPLSQRHEELLCSSGIPKAVDQIASTIGLLRRGTLTFPGLPAYDWTTTPIIPVIITEEEAPQAPFLWERLYKPFNRPLEALQGAGPIVRLRFLSIDEVETLPEVESQIDLATLMYRWAANVEYHELPWLAYLDATGTRTTGRVIHDRFVEAMSFLTERLDLDVEPLKRLVK